MTVVRARLTSCSFEKLRIEAAERHRGTLCTLRRYHLVRIEAAERHVGAY